MRTLSDDDSDPTRDARPSKAALRDMLKRAVVNTGGQLVKGELAPKPEARRPAPPAIPVAAKPAPAPIPAALARAKSPPGVRYVEPIEFKGKREPVLSAAPKLRMADPTVLRIEASYQRDLSRKSYALIQKIIGAWDWAKFKPPVCAQTDQGLFVIDGQHTAIAAASHPEIGQIPILIVEAAAIKRRAEAFVAHNRDRVVMTPAQILHGEVAAGVSDSVDIVRTVERAGGSVPRLPIEKKYAKPGQMAAVGELRLVYKAHGSDVLARMVRIAVASQHAPTSLTILRAIRAAVTGPHSKLSDKIIAAALAAITNFDVAAEARAAGTGNARHWGGAQLLTERLRKHT